MSFLIPAAIFAGSIALVGLVAFAVWPLLGDPLIDPSINLLENADEVADFDQRLMAFSQLTALGYPVFGIAFATWTGFAAGIYGAFAAATMILSGNRILGMLLPMGVYIVETIAAGLTVGPYAGLLYSLAPAGLQQVPFTVTMAPSLVLAVAVALAWAVIFRRPQDLSSLR